MKKFEKKSELLEKGLQQMASMSDEELKRLFPQLSAASAAAAGRNRIFTPESTFFLFMW